MKIQLKYDLIGLISASILHSINRTIQVGFAIEIEKTGKQTPNVYSNVQAECVI